jgi:choline dehydrogenase-like flavoprotein
MGLPSREPNVLGNTNLSSFDAIIIGSGAGGSTVANALTKHGKSVLVIETGNNYFQGLDNPAPGKPVPLFSNDELKFGERHFITPDPLIEPRKFRPSPSMGERTLVGDVNGLPKTVGGGAVHADMKYPRFQEWDFHLASELGNIPNANFANWPITYDELEPFYSEIEWLVGVQGEAGSDPFEPRRSKPYPMAPGVAMYCSLLAQQGAQKLGYQAFPYPTAINSRPYGGRPPCVDCGACGGYGCPNNSKGSPAVTLLRAALLTERCQVRYNCTVARVQANGASISAIEYIDSKGSRQQATAHVYVLSASAIESARLCLLSDADGPGLGNSSGQVGRNLMFHLQTQGVGIFPQRLHGHRGRALTHGISDFRGRPGDPEHPLAGIIELGAATEIIVEAQIYALALGQRGSRFKNLMRQSPMRDHLMGLTMQAEDAPQVTNYVDLDPEIVDVYGLPVARITYESHPWEIATRDFYSPKLVEILKAAGAQFGFIAPIDVPSASRHIMGTLRMGDDPSSSVCDATGKFHDLDNLYCADGSIFVTSSGYNPTLTIQALALRTAGNLVFPGSPERVIRT